MRKGKKVKESCRGGKTPSFGVNFIDKAKNYCYKSLTELI